MNGYPTDKGCSICGEKPAVIEPRFLYVTCDEHSNLSPLDFQNILYNGRWKKHIGEIDMNNT